MTGQELRQKVASIISSWQGATRGSKTHLEILDIYNNYKPLARGYKVQVKDAWCATTVSATWIKAGIASYTGTECSCTQFITIAKKKGYWTENDAYVPKIGDAIIYDWDDPASGYATTDNTGGPEHIGIVISCDGKNFNVMEGNKGSNSAVGVRAMKVNGRYIRGFITPDYDAIAKAITPAAPIGPTPQKEEETMTQDKFNQMFEKAMNAYLTKLAAQPATWEAADMEWAKNKGLISGDEQGRTMAKKFVTRGEMAAILHRNEGV